MCLFKYLEIHSPVGSIYDEPGTFGHQKSTEQQVLGSLSAIEELLVCYILTLLYYENKSHNH